MRISEAFADDDYDFLAETFGWEDNRSVDEILSSIE
jgi:hypothetical protein